MIDLLGMVVFGTIVGIGLLDGRRGLSVFERYHSAGVAGRRRAPKMRRRGGEDQPKRRRQRGWPRPRPWAPRSK